MAFDMKRLKMFRYLDDISCHKASYAKHVFNPLKNIYVFCGSIYATNGIVLVKVDYPEFEHLSDDVWSTVDEFCDADGCLLENPIISECEKQFTNNRIFDEQLTGDYDSASYDIIADARVIKAGLKPFELYSIAPLIYLYHDRMSLQGHSNDISIRVAIMGKVR